MSSKKIQNLRSFTVQIRHIQTQAIVGTGFVVSPDGLIATCAHVVVAAGLNPRLGQPIPSYWKLVSQRFLPGNNVQDVPTPIPVYFQWARISEQKAQWATLQSCFYDCDDDAVLLRLQSALPEGIIPADLDTAENAVGYEVNHQFDSLGYRRELGYQGMPANGTIINFSGAPSDDRTLQNDVLMLQSQHIDSGMSGAAVLDKQLNKVVGIIAETYDVQEKMTDRDTSFAVDYAVVQRLLSQNGASSDVSLVSLTQSDRASQTSPSEPTTVPVASSGVRPVALAQTPLPPNRLDLKRAPNPLEEWVGREDLLQSLDQDWGESDRSITGLIGFGGEGKSSLARRWIENLLHSNLPQPDGVFWWGFYDNRDVDKFFEALLLYLEPGIDLSQYASSSAKVAYLKTGLHRSRHRFVLVLDGLEVLQHPEGDDYGLFTSVDLKNWLRDFAEATHSSFCLITTRAPLLDLIDYSTYTHREVERLSDNEGVALLQKLGVRGSEPDRSDLKRVVQQWGGYALVLSLLGSYLVDHCGGDIRQLPADLAPTATETKYDRVSRVLRRYDEVLTPEERSFLEGFSAFRLPVPTAVLEVIPPTPLEKRGLDREARQIPSPYEQEGLWAVVRRTLLPPFLRGAGGDQSTTMSQQNRSNSTASETIAVKAIVHRLVTYRILQHNADNDTYTTHPLIRDHYLQRLKQDRDRATTLHRQIADLYLAAAGETPENPTLNDLTPLIEAVHHRCQAGDYNGAFNEIVWERIYQRDRAILVHQLGAYDTALTLMQEFFLEGDTTQNPQVSAQGDQRWILNEIGFNLMSLGRLGEAPSFYERKNEAAIQLEDWQSLSNGYQNLASLYIYLGNLPASASAAESALTSTRRAENQQYEQFSLEWQAWADHLLGHLDAATDAFQQASAILQQRDPDKQYLYSLSGIQHADHLRRRGESDYARRITEANRSICEQNRWLDDLSLCYRVLGSLDDDTNLPTAQSHYKEALRLARSISKRDVLIEALLARGRWAARQGDAAAAGSDLEEALGYAMAGGYRLYEADIRVGLAWMYRTAGNLDAARQEALRAQRMSEAMGYYWGQKDAAEVLEALEQVA